MLCYVTTDHINYILRTNQNGRVIYLLLYRAIEF